MYFVLITYDNIDSLVYLFNAISTSLGVIQYQILRQFAIIWFQEGTLGIMVIVLKKKKKKKKKWN